LGNGVVPEPGSRPSELPEDDHRELKNAPARPKYKGINKLLEHGYTLQSELHVGLQRQLIDTNGLYPREE